MSQHLADSTIESLERLGRLLDEGRIAESEYDYLKGELLDVGKASDPGSPPTFPDPQGEAGATFEPVPTNDPVAVNPAQLELAKQTTSSFDSNSQLADGLLLTAAAYWVLQMAFGLSVASDSWWGPGGIPDWMLTWEEWYLLQLIVTAAVFVTWSYRAHANLRLLERNGIKHQDHETIWWWVVPVANLFMPFRVLRETARGTSSNLEDPHWKSRAFPRVVNVWTWAFVGGMLLTQYAERLFGSARTLDEMGAAGVTYALGAASLVVAAVAGSTMVREITVGQKVQMRKLNITASSASSAD